GAAPSPTALGALFFSAWPILQGILPMPKSVTLKGEPVTVTGTELKVGDTAPDVNLSKNLKESAKLSDFKGKTVIICSVPSLDTPVCDREGQRFNKEAEKLGEDVKVLMV